MTKGELAECYFRQGYNCSQAVALAFCDETGLDEKTTERLTIGFGGGIGRMREVCGAMNASVFVLGAAFNEDKSSIYKRVQELADTFKKQNGSIICRELLGLSSKGNDSPNAEARTPEYYKKRPCPLIVHDAANALDAYLKANKK